MATLLLSIPGKGTAASVGSCHPGHFCIAALLCDSCKLVMWSPELDHHTKIECLHRALTTAGEAAERGSPARMAALVACLRDAFLSSDVPEKARLTLLELVELRASDWKLSLEQQLSYASLNDVAGDECDNVQNLSLLYSSRSLLWQLALHDSARLTFWAHSFSPGAVAGRKILTLLLPRVGNNPSGGFILLPGDFFAEDHLLERHPRSVSLGRPS
ncbi:hypothetical protein MRX96_054726 [Rhipicephalus microplus]